MFFNEFHLRALTLRNLGFLLQNCGSACAFWNRIKVIWDCWHLIRWFLMNSCLAIFGLYFHYVLTQTRPFCCTCALSKSSLVRPCSAGDVFESSLAHFGTLATFSFHFARRENPIISSLIYKGAHIL